MCRVIGCNVIAGKTSSTSLILETSSMYMFSISSVSAIEGLNVAVRYVCLKPDGFTFSISRTRSVRFAMRVVDTMLGIAVVKLWNTGGGLGMGLAWSMRAVLKKVVL